MINLESDMEGLDPKLSQHSELVEINGVPLLSGAAERWDRISTFKARVDDLLICTYPKAGTTWMQETVDLIQHGGDPQKCAQVPIYKRMPFIEMHSPLFSRLEEAELMPSPRTLKSHLPIQLLPPSFWEQNCKIIYVARNPKDNAISYFHFQRMNRRMPDPGTWDEFLEKFIAGKRLSRQSKVIYVARNAKDNLVSYFFFDQMNVTQPDPGPWEGYVKKFMEGKVAWGSWYDHVRRYWDEKGNHRILYLFYEDMKEDLAREVRRVKDFLEVDLPEDIIQKIVHHASFQTMKTNPMANYETVPSVVFDKTKGNFMRKGEVGDWKNYFTVAQREEFDADYRRKMEGTTLRFRDEL